MWAAGEEQLQVCKGEPEVRVATHQPDRGQSLGPKARRTQAPGQAAQSPCHAAQMGALGRSRDKLRQEQSESPLSYLGRCQQTGPHAGVQGRGARGRQGGAHVCVGITGGDDNTDTHT